MTGEITLSGRVLPVGGIKEKVLAAKRLGINEVILPKQNGKNIDEDLTPELRQNLIVHLVSTIEGRLRSDVTHFAAFAACAFESTASRLMSFSASTPVA